MNTTTNSLLAWFDRLLLLAIIGLLVAERLGNRKGSGETAPILAQQETENERPHYVVQASQHTISFSPEGVTQSRVSRIARALSHESSWQDAPVKQAVDMREHDGQLNIAFALSNQIDEKSVLVSTEGNVLSLSASPLNNPKAKILRQFYIPYSPQQIGPVETTVSNGIVRVRIQLDQ
jgi:HSP20 family molecular chaperone IbpA